ncbi:MAG: D-glycero-beta-D-manno-heptose 1,7-bisphosphate 7-phosphatase [Gammaproteobacteria bacterium]|nr:D-glycero-beta-D-manno-heptose 1,7-bisphosphate 7-phosphatase [Gammaproteobacteria bacterium]
MKAILLDRDGVINEEIPGYVRTSSQWVPIPGSMDALKRLKEAGFLVIVITNQGGIGRGLYTEADLALIHQAMCMRVDEAGGRIDKILYCPHHPEEECVCRKPNPSLLYEAAALFHLDLSRTHFVGDSLRDVEAAKTAGCIPLLVRTGNGAKTEEAHRDKLEGVRVCDDLNEAVAKIVVSG